MLELSISDFSIEFCHTKVHDQIIYFLPTYLLKESINICLLYTIFSLHRQYFGSILALLCLYNITKILLTQTQVTQPILAILFRPFDCIVSKLLNYLAIQSFVPDWRLFQKRIVRIKLDIYVLFYIQLCYLLLSFIKEALSANS